MLKTAKICLVILFAFLLSVQFSAELGQAQEARTEEYTTYNTPRFILHIGQTNQQAVGYAVDPDTIAKTAISILDTTYDELTRIFQAQPQRQVVLRFLSPAEFRRQTGAPSWTSAMYFRDEITLPISARSTQNLADLSRALRHEYVHAFIAELSNYRCPAWLDEGVAQILEGHPNPLLGPALRKWISQNPAIPLEWLNDGFTTLDAEFVPAAYAQSLFATRKLIQQLGFSAITNYLSHLRQGKSEDKAFYLSFGRSKASFEEELTHEIRLWSQSGKKHP